MAQGALETLEQLDETLDELEGQLSDVEATVKDLLAVAMGNKEQLPTPIPSKLLELAATISRAQREMAQAWDMVTDELSI